MEYILHVLVMIGIYTILSLSLNLVVGYTGLLSIAQAGFYGIGAYVAALMALDLQTPFLLNAACAIAVGSLLGALVGISSIRIRDDYFAIATFAFQVIVFSILNNWSSLTGGPMGVPGIPEPAIFGFTVSSHLRFLFVVGFFCVASVCFVDRVVSSPFGRVLKAIREDEVFALAAGKNVAGCKLLVFTIGAGLAALAGTLYAYYISFIDPTSFTVMESIFVISIVVIGGAGSLWGPLIGAVTLVTIPEILRFIGVPAPVAASLRQVIYGGLLITLMMFRPEGLKGRYNFRRTT